MLFFALAFFIAVNFASEEVEGADIYQFHQNKQNYRANILSGESVEASQYNSRGELDPARKRSEGEVLATDLSLEQMQPTSACLAGFGNCTYCNNELYYYACSLCYFCCRAYTYGFGYYYYTCTTCQIQYCYYCRNSLHSVNGTCYDYATYTIQGQNGVAPCTDANSYPIYCTDNNTQVVAQQLTFRTNLTLDIGGAWLLATTANTNLGVVPIIDEITDFVVTDNTTLSMYCTVTYSYLAAPNVNQSEVMQQIVTNSFSHYYNIQASRISFQNSTQTPGLINVTIVDNASAKSLVSLFLLGLSMVFLLF